MTKTTLIILFVLSPYLFLTCSGYRDGVDSLTEHVGNVSTQTIVPTPTISNGSKWRAATFMTIKVGTDTRTRVLSVLGKPAWTGTPFDESGEADVEKYIRDEFKVVDDIFTKIVVTSFKVNGRVDFIEASVPNLPVSMVLERFGQNFQRKLMSNSGCDPGNPNSVIYVESDDEFSSIYYLYPELGIFIPATNQETVRTVLFISESFASNLFKCKLGNDQ